MAIHSSIPSMLRESLVEMFLVAKDCINFRKDPNVWGSQGCYGYPAAVLLFSIADSIGSYVLSGRTRDHFNILNHNDYYNLNLDTGDIEIIYKSYRCLLTHNAVMAPDTVLDIGQIGDTVFEVVSGVPKVNLAPFLEITQSFLIKFFEDIETIVGNSQQLRNILNG